MSKQQAVVTRKPIQFGVGTLSRMLEDLCITNMDIDEQDLQQLINKLWPVLICEHEGDDDE